MESIHVNMQLLLSASFVVLFTLTFSCLSAAECIGMFTSMFDILKLTPGPLDCNLQYTVIVASVACILICNVINPVQPTMKTVASLKQALSKKTSCI